MFNGAPFDTHTHTHTLSPKHTHTHTLSLTLTHTRAHLLFPMNNKSTPKCCQNQTRIDLEIFLLKFMTICIEKFN